MGSWRVGCGPGLHSPGNEAVLILKRPCWTIGGQHRESHDDDSGLLDGSVAAMVVEISCRKARISGIYLDPRGLQLLGVCDLDQVKRCFRRLICHEINGPNSEAGSELSVSEPNPLDMLTILPAADLRRSGSSAFVTATTPKTFVS